MGFIRRPGGKFQPAPDDGRARDVERRLDPVRDQDIGMTEGAGEDFRGRENDVGGHPDESDAGAGLEIAGRSVRVRVRGHRMSESIKAIVYEAHGKPEEVLRLEEQPLRETGRRRSARSRPRRAGQSGRPEPDRRQIPDPFSAAGHAGFRGSRHRRSRRTGGAGSRGRRAGHSPARPRHLAGKSGRGGRQADRCA